MSGRDNFEYFALKEANNFPSEIYGRWQCSGCMRQCKLWDLQGWRKFPPPHGRKGCLQKVFQRECLSRSGYTVQSQPPPPRFGDPVSPNQPETLARIVV